MEVPPFTNHPGDPLAKVLVLKGSRLSSGHREMIPLNLKLNLSPSHFQQPHAGVINPYSHGKTELLLYHGNEKQCVWNKGDPLRHLLVLLCPVIKVNENLQQSFLGRTTNGSDPLGVKV